MISFSAFVEEVESIQKEAGWMQNVGLPWAKSALRATHPDQIMPQLGRGNTLKMLANEAKSAPANVVKTVRAMGSPIKALRRGVDYTAEGLRANALLNGTLLGMGTLAAVPMVTLQQDPTGENMSRAGRAARFAGQQVGGLVGAPFGIAGALAGGYAGDVAGKTVGKAIDKARGRRSRAPKPQERVAISDRMTSPTNVVAIPDMVNSG